MTAYACREHVLRGCFFDYHQESKQQRDRQLSYTMSSFEGIPHQQPLDASPVPVTDKNAESLLDTSMPAAPSTEKAEL
jgi:hypothetical protein